MSDATIKELEQLQNEKRKMLLEHETLKLKQREEAFSIELKEWKGKLKPRKQVRLLFACVWIWHNITNLLFTKIDMILIQFFFYCIVYIHKKVKLL